jgi:hypothetical protein
MSFAEHYTVPLDGELHPSIRRVNDFGEYFYVRFGKIRFQVHGDIFTNVKVILKVYRSDSTCEHFIVDTDPYDVQDHEHKRVTRDFVIHPSPLKLGQITCVKFSYIFHLGGRSICSHYDYIFMDGSDIREEGYQWRRISRQWATHNAYQTIECDPDILQRDVDWYNRNFHSLNIIPKFTKGQSQHPFHPKRFIHDQIKSLIYRKGLQPEREISIKVCVDCIDDTDFVNHLLYAASQGVKIQCIVDWRKMTLTNSDNYLRLKRSGLELLGVFCSSCEGLVEVAPDMHTKFIIFGDESCLVGSFNITFDRWGANWESGATFHSRGICRLLDNIFQSIRGGVCQRYGIDPLSQFNLLYTFGRHKMMNGRNFRPHQAIISAIHQGRRSLKASLFLLGEMQGDHQDSVVDALIQAKNRGVDVILVFNGHMAREGDPAKEYTMREELRRPLLPAIERLHRAGVPIALAYGLHDRAIPYSPLHSKYCIIDDHIVLDGSFNWYNTSVYSHDLLMVIKNTQTAELYLYEFHDTLKSMRIYWS